MTSRREFLTVLACAACAGSAAACGGGFTDPGGADVTGTRRIPLMAVGATVAIANFGPGGQGVAVTRLATATVVAVSRRCTHAGCTVGLPLAAGANMKCPCHGSQYTTQGDVLQGPATHPLTSFPATIDDVTNEVEVVVS
jgi:Rieske Fe-S protein